MCSEIGKVLQLFEDLEQHFTKSQTIIQSKTRHPKIAGGQASGYQCLIYIQAQVDILFFHLQSGLIVLIRAVLLILPHPKPPVLKNIFRFERETAGFRSGIN